MVKHQVQDDPHNKRTWDADQTWSAMNVRELQRNVGEYSPGKLRKMLKYYRAFKMAKHRNVVVKELERRRS